jgi:hypothetical protein
MKKLELNAKKIENFDVEDNVKQRAEMLVEIQELRKVKSDLPDIFFILEIHLNEFLFYLTTTEFVQETIVTAFIDAEAKIMNLMQALKLELEQDATKN